MTIRRIPEQGRPTDIFDAPIKSFNSEATLFTAANGGVVLIAKFEDEFGGTYQEQIELSKEDLDLIKTVAQ